MWEIIGIIISALSIIGGVIYAFSRQATQLEEFRDAHAEQIKRFYSELEKIDDRIESSDTSFNDIVGNMRAAMGILEQRMDEKKLDKEIFAEFTRQFERNSDRNSDEHTKIFDCLTEIKTLVAGIKAT